MLFVTGVEDSNATIHNDRVHRDQMGECGHYRQWKRDLDLLTDLDVGFLRYGPLRFVARMAGLVADTG